MAIFIILFIVSSSLAFDISIYDNRLKKDEVYIELMCKNEKIYRLFGIKRKHQENRQVIKEILRWRDDHVIYDCKEGYEF